MNLRTWRPKNPVITGLLFTVASGITAAFVANRLGAPKGVSGAVMAPAAILGFLVHDRWVDADWPFNLPPFNRIPNRRLAGPTYTP